MFAKVSSAETCNKLIPFEKRPSRVTGGIFILVGIYHCSDAPAEILARIPIALLISYEQSSRESLNKALNSPGAAVLRWFKQAEEGVRWLRRGLRTGSQTKSWELKTAYQLTQSPESENSRGSLVTCCGRRVTRAVAKTARFSGSTAALWAASTTITVATAPHKISPKLSKSLFSMPVPPEHFTTQAT